MDIHCLFHQNQLDYDGTQLRELFARTMGCPAGNSAIVFRGACHVDVAHLVDSADALAQQPIHSDDMLHVIMEFFSVDLLATVYLQRLFMVCVLEELLGRGVPALRRGDDIFVDHRKFSVSIATASRVSTLIHVGMNISSRNTPLPTVALGDLAIEPWEFARHVLDRFSREVRSCWEARCKVWGVS